MGGQKLNREARSGAGDFRTAASARVDQTRRCSRLVPLCVETARRVGGSAPADSTRLALRIAPLGRPVASVLKRMSGEDEVFQRRVAWLKARHAAKRRAEREAEFVTPTPVDRDVALREWIQHRDRRRAEELPRQQALQAAIRDFLERAGIKAVDIDGGVRIDTLEFRFRTNEQKKSANRVIDRLVAELLGGRLLDVVNEQIVGRNFDVRAVPGERGVRLEHARRDVALIRATRAHVFGETEVHGNFIADGSHWRAFCSVLSVRVGVRARRRISAASVASPKTTLLTALPACASQSYRDAANVASSRIRTERSLEFGHPVVLQTPSLEVRFEPISAAGVTELPFSYSDGSRRLAGNLRLRTPQDPLALALTDAAADEPLIAEAWALALLGYAELTCEPQEPLVATAERRRRSTTAMPHGGFRVGEQLARDVAETSGPPRRKRDVRFSVHLLADAQTQRVLAGCVAGHRRVLPPGQSAGEAAQQYAACLGISLRAGETWVRAHLRGAPACCELRFHWHPPI